MGEIEMAWQRERGIPPSTSSLHNYRAHRQQQPLGHREHHLKELLGTLGIIPFHVSITMINFSIRTFQRLLVWQSKYCSTHIDATKTACILARNIVLIILYRYQLITSKNMNPSKTTYPICGQNYQDCNVQIWFTTPLVNSLLLITDDDENSGFHEKIDA